MLDIRDIGDPKRADSPRRPNEGPDDVERPVSGRADRDPACNEGLEIGSLVSPLPGDPAHRGAGEPAAPAAAADGGGDGERVARLQRCLEALRDKLEQLPAALPGEEVTRSQSDPDDDFSARGDFFSLKLDRLSFFDVAHPE